MSKQIDIKPKGPRLLVLLEGPQEKTDGGIIIPDAHKKQSQFGVVQAIGDPLETKSGLGTREYPAKVGDRVMVSKYGGIEIKVDEYNLKMFNADDILAVIVITDVPDPSPIVPANGVPVDRMGKV